MDNKQHPIENLMLTAMTSLESMVDVNTIVGDAVTSADGTLIIPVSKVTFGFAAGGSEFNSNKLNKYSDTANLPFGGGSGAGVNISPMAFLVVKDGNTKLLTMQGVSPVDKLVDLIPDVVNKAGGLVEKTMQKPKEVLKNTFDKTENNKKLNKNRQELAQNSPDDFEDSI